MERESTTVCIQGLGFVGSAMAVAVASATDNEGHPLYDVWGVDLPTESGTRIVNALSEGIFPFENSDAELEEALLEAHRKGNLHATCENGVYGKADIIVVDVNLDVDYHEDGTPYVDLSSFRRAIKTLGDEMSSGCLVIVETTVPPGTCEKIVEPLLRECFEARGLDPDSVLVAHAYERVMPGSDYLNSIVNYWRVYSATSEEAAKRCDAFLSSIVNIEDYPLTRLSKTTASETAKVLENSYRAATIAFMEEWSRFAEAVHIDLFEVIDAIRMRPTHSNMRQPGFGVGGYCLTKDPYFAPLAAHELFGCENLEFPFSVAAVEANNRMPLVTLDKIEDHFQGSLKGRKVLVLGVSYRQDVGDTRHSPTETFVRAAEENGLAVTCHDPLVERWPEMNREVLSELPSFEDYDVVVFAVAHASYQDIDMINALEGSQVVIVDANRVLTEKQRGDVKKAGVELVCIGRG